MLTFINPTQTIEESGKNVEKKPLRASGYSRQLKQQGEACANHHYYLHQEQYHHHHHHHDRYMNGEDVRLVWSIYLSTPSWTPIQR